MNPIPGVRAVDHVGFSVPDLDQAVDFFTVVLGAVEVLRHPPFPPSGDVAVRQFARHPDSSVEGIVMLRLGLVNIELIQYSSPDQNTHFPSTSDFGGHHLALYVDDLAASVDHLRSVGVEVLGEPMNLRGPEAGDGAQFIYFRAPWGLFCELVSYPTGKAYETTSQYLLFDPRSYDGA